MGAMSTTAEGSEEVEDQNSVHRGFVAHVVVIVATPFKTHIIQRQQWWRCR